MALLYRFPFLNSLISFKEVGYHMYMYVCVLSIYTCVVCMYLCVWFVYICVVCVVCVSYMYVCLWTCAHTHVCMYTHTCGHTCTLGHYASNLKIWDWQPLPPNVCSGSWGKSLDSTDPQPLLGKW